MAIVWLKKAVERAILSLRSSSEVSTVDVFSGKGDGMENHVSI